MKKLLLSLFALGSIYTASAQTIVNPGFESAATAVSGFVSTYQTAGWNVLFNGSLDASTKTEGLNSCKLQVLKDAALNSTLSWGDSIIPGFISQELLGLVSNPADFQVSFDYKFAPVGGDSAYLQVVIYDTLTADVSGQPSNDRALYYGYLELTSAVANWTNKVLTMTPVPNATGTANRILISATCSETGYFNLAQPHVGTSFWLDNFKKGYVGIEENTASTVKVFPNPANDVLNIKADGEISNVTITTLEGKVVSSTTSSSVNVAELTAGMYIYQVMVNGKVSTGNFVKN
jgi:hypothetical protein